MICIQSEHDRDKIYIIGISCAVLHIKKILYTSFHSKEATVIPLGHMEKQETEIKPKLEMETGNGNRKLKTEMEMQLLRCCRPSKI